MRVTNGFGLASFLGYISFFVRSLNQPDTTTAFSLFSRPAVYREIQPVPISRPRLGGLGDLLLEVPVHLTVLLVLNRFGVLRSLGETVSGGSRGQSQYAGDHSSDNDQYRPHFHASRRRSRNHESFLGSRQAGFKYPITLNRRLELRSVYAFGREFHMAVRP